MFYLLSGPVLSGLTLPPAVAELRRSGTPVSAPSFPNLVASSLSAQDMPVPAASGSGPMLPMTSRSAFTGPSAAENMPIPGPIGVGYSPLAIWVGPVGPGQRQGDPAGYPGSYPARSDYYAQPRFAPQFPQMPINANLGLIFPVATPAPITSGFGWRTHPIWGDRRFHAGTDIGAAQGTPVLAAAAGQVTHGGNLGGYGLVVEIVHGDGGRETLYGHLSQTLVTEGQWVGQGQVIGLVGSSGAATGPHLHFELRQRSSEGWTAVDPGGQLKQALARLTQRDAG
jgi:murein DD-endopeptidase MepM/ murein hydrolase activator NlpD